MSAAASAGQQQVEQQGEEVSSHWARVKPFLPVSSVFRRSSGMGIPYYCSLRCKTIIGNANTSSTLNKRYTKHD